MFVFILECINLFNGFIYLVSMLSRRKLLEAISLMGAGLVLSPLKVFAGDEIIFENNEVPNFRPPLIYLTIDDGPRKTMPFILERLSEEHYVTFFVIGRYLKNPNGFNLALEALNRGHTIGNHSYSHPCFSMININRVETEIARSDELINKLYQISGRTNPKVFRFPYGNVGGRKRHAVAEILEKFEYCSHDWGEEGMPGWNGNTAYGWEIDTLDWMHYDPKIRKSTKSILRRLDKSLDRDVVLFHDFPLALKIIDKCLERGFKLRALPQIK